MALADRIAVLRDGTFVQVGTPEEIYASRRSIEVARLFGDPTINRRRKPQSRRSGMPPWSRLRAPWSTSIPAISPYTGGDGDCGIRPEAVVVAQGAHMPGALAAMVEAVTPLNETHRAAAQRERLGIPGIAAIVGRGDSGGGRRGQGELSAAAASTCSTRQPGSALHATA